MSENKTGSEVMVLRDDSIEQPIPTVWRPVFRDIVEAFVAGDYQLKVGVLGVKNVSEETAAQIRNYIQDYGATLVALPEETWESSICIWSGTRWDVLVDLWTQEEGPSDLVLSAQVTEVSPGFVFNIYMVYVP
jgi:hypothetical protein